MKAEELTIAKVEALRLRLAGFADRMERLADDCADGAASPKQAVVRIREILELVEDFAREARGEKTKR